MRSLLLVVSLGLFLVALPPAGQADEPKEESQPEQLAREGVEKLMRALDAFIQMIPQYEMPQLNEDGDIIIKRKHNDGDSPEKPKGKDDDQTST